ncbi:MAG TPA: YceI family protein [Acidimicrobiales bacterium]|nr:YceI family protein [Acidimicrobiales bacterium]
MALARRRLGLAAGAVVVVLLAAGFGGWWFLLRDDAPKAASIEAAGETLDEAAASGGDPGGDVDVEGAWTVDSSIGSFDDFSGTWAGYRADEELASVGATTAVGRTPNVSGTMTVVGDEVTAVAVEVDLTTLKSDKGQRDNALRGRGLQTDQFPTATFSLTEPLALPDGLGSGADLPATGTGDLTIHGVTRSVTVEMTTTLQGGTAAVVGSAPVKLSDFGIEAPTGFSVLSIKDDATFEFQIFFTKQ